MDKIWIIQSGSKYQKKFRIYQKESQLLKAISKDKNAVILEYDLVSKVTAEDFLTSRERDTRLRSVLGELDKKEQAVLDFINLYEKIAPVGKEFKKRISWHESIETSTKEQMLNRLKKFQTEPKEVAKILVNEKRYFIGEISDSVEWLTAVLKVHNFRDYKTDRKVWNRETRKYEESDTSSEELKTNFKLAKKNLRK